MSRFLSPGVQALMDTLYEGAAAGGVPGDVADGLPTGSPRGVAAVDALLADLWS